MTGRCLGAEAPRYSKHCRRIFNVGTHCKGRVNRHIGRTHEKPHQPKGRVLQKGQQYHHVAASVRRATGKKVSIAVCRHPAGAGKMRLPSTESPLRLLLRIDVQNNLGDLAPVRIFCRRVEQPDVGEQPLFVVPSQDRRSGRLVGDIRVKQRFAHAFRQNSRIVPS